MLCSSMQVECSTGWCRYRGWTTSRLARTLSSHKCPCCKQTQCAPRCLPQATSCHERLSRHASGRHSAKHQHRQPQPSEAWPWTLVALQSP